MLSVLGLEEAEERAYRRLIEVPSGSADDLVDLLNCGPAQAEAVLTALEVKGLVARSPGSAHRFVASPPQVALGALVVERQEDLRRAQHELGALAETYRGAAVNRTVNDVVDVVLGSHAVAQRFAQLQRAAKHQIQLLAKSQFVVVQPEDNADETLALARGVTYQVALERGNLERDGFFDEVTDSIQNGVQVRIAHTIPVRLLIVDGELALVPLPAAGDQNPGGGALLIHPSGLLDALKAVFGLVWESASEIVLTGDTLDQAIGGQLRLSLRTVQRRVRLLMDRAQVETRLQLGYQARRRGWL